MNPWLRLALITMSVGGGFTGVAVILQSLLSPHSEPVAYHVLMIGFLTLYVFVTISGLVFVQNPKRTGPLIVALALQIPWISSPIIAYKFVAGFQVSAAFIGSEFNGGFRLGSDFQINVFQQLPWGVGINIFALAMLILLARSVGTAYPSLHVPK